ncbi:alpha-1,4-glucan--maltose-1-phosphate maltosyltransferase [Salinispira pacifica]
MTDGRNRVVIEHIEPAVDGGRFPAKRVVGENVEVGADVFADGHDIVSAAAVYRGPLETKPRRIALEHRGNDRWHGDFQVLEVGTYRFTVEGWVDHFATWQHDLKKRFDAGQNPAVYLIEGAAMMEEAVARAGEADAKTLQEASAFLRSRKSAEARVLFGLNSDLHTVMARCVDEEFVTRFEREYEIFVERKRALFSSWYERFPRSVTSTPGSHGTLKECVGLLPEIASMGFHVWYLPPIHPIGRTSRKGRNNSPEAAPDDVGSPWAIGAKEGGHKAVHPDLGTMADFEALVKAAKEKGIEIALDLALQCSPDHPYVSEHPQWFKWRSDGSIQYAENPPKKYQDVVPIDFETESWRELWDELLSIVLFWAEKGVRIFRVDNPHTKPFDFWEWLIRESRAKYPDLIFLAEAFTRPKVMYRLAKLGFSQSYTYFTWRNTKHEIERYIRELVSTEAADFFRPNFWPNTPDILPEILQYGGRQAFITRAVLAATLSSNYGIYGPLFELCISEAVAGTEEYLHSEKYELRSFDPKRKGNIRQIISRLNTIRNDNPALHHTRNLELLPVDNEFLLAYAKTDQESGNTIVVVVNLDLHHTQSGWIQLPEDSIELPENQSFMVHDLLSDDRFIWSGRSNYVQLSPHSLPAHLFRLRRFMKREHDFDYYM